jgi:hypothetical protein
VVSFLSSSGYRRGGCVALATGSAMGLWEVKSCTLFRARYICRQSLGTPVTPELPGPDPTPSLTDSCPQGWASDPKLRHCYKVGQSVGMEGAKGRTRAKGQQREGPRGNIHDPETSPQTIDRSNFFFWPYWSLNSGPCAY